MADALAALRSVCDVGVGHPATSDAADAASRSLYWSCRGEVACAVHAPEPESPRWAEERWAEMEGRAQNRHRRKFQCQHCSASRTPIAHHHLNWVPAVVNGACVEGSVSMSKTIWRLRESLNNVVECCIDETQSKSHTLTVRLGPETFLHETYPDEAGATKRAIQLRDWLLKNGAWTDASGPEALNSRLHRAS